MATPIPRTCATVYTFLQAEQSLPHPVVGVIKVFSRTRLSVLQVDVLGCHQTFASASDVVLIFEPGVGVAIEGQR